MKDKIGWFEITKDNLGPDYLNIKWDGENPVIVNSGRYPHWDLGEEIQVPLVDESDAYSENDVNNDKMMLVGVQANSVDHLHCSDFFHFVDGNRHGYFAITTQAVDLDLHFDEY